RVHAQKKEHKTARKPGKQHCRNGDSTTNKHKPQSLDTRTGNGYGNVINEYSSCKKGNDGFEIPNINVFAHHPHGCQNEPKEKSPNGDRFVFEQPGDGKHANANTQYHSGK